MCDSLEFALGGAGLEDVGDGDGRVAVGEVGIVTTAGHGYPEAVPGHPGHRDVVHLPSSVPAADLKAARANAMD